MAITQGIYVVIFTGSPDEPKLVWEHHCPGPKEALAFSKGVSTAARLLRGRGERTEWVFCWIEDLPREQHRRDINDEIVRLAQRRLEEIDNLPLGSSNGHR